VIVRGILSFGKARELTSLNRIEFGLLPGRRGIPIIRRDKAHSLTENRCYALGRTNMGRLLFATFAIRDNKIRIISARDMTEVEMERYLR